ncbi:MAG: hypothetical protein GF408_06975 [Candidatus Omnitrophica bacterium]|nr:hypothetical protein [Candidatus Omnitrophota bacterium]
MKLTEEKSLYYYETPDGVTAGFSSARIGGLGEVRKRIGDIAYMEQVHGARISVVKKPARYRADGIFTVAKGLFTAVMTADCLPLLFYSLEAGVAGAVHMGWRSAEKGIIGHIRLDLSSFTVIAGPGMRKCCYEVGSEFEEKPVLAPHISRREGGIYFDPVGFAREQLLKKGLKEEGFRESGICTLCGGSGLPSFRGTGTGQRTISFAGLDDPKSGCRRPLDLSQ